MTCSLPPPTPQRLPMFNRHHLTPGPVTTCLLTPLLWLAYRTQSVPHLPASLLKARSISSVGPILLIHPLKRLGFPSRCGRRLISDTRILTARDGKLWSGHRPRTTPFFCPISLVEFLLSAHVLGHLGTPRFNCSCPGTSGRAAVTLLAQNSVASKMKSNV